MNGLRSGTESAAGAVMSTISSVAGRISGALSSALKIGSPSRLTIPMGVDLMRGLEVGHGARWTPRPGPTPNLPQSCSPLGGGAPRTWPGSAVPVSTVINVYPQRGQDEREIAAMVSRELAWATAGGMR